ncbi:MAG: hypothetical protein SPG50_02060 [Muribaculaceae bacterium]|nr:hypothetical protein [Muribaculaceae bacterium]
MRVFHLIVCLLGCAFSIFADVIPNLGEIENYIVSHTSKNVSEVNVSTETPGSFNLMWSDPGYVEGPSISDSQEFIVISYTTTTYNEDATVIYSDVWKYYFPTNGAKYCYRYNRYSGKCYHGGSLVYLFGDNSLAKSDLQKVLCHEWSSFEIDLFNILLKDRQ